MLLSGSILSLCQTPRNRWEENQVLTQHENRWQSKCGASWEISPLWACYCIPSDRPSRVFAMTAMKAPAHTRTERKRGENRGEERWPKSPVQSETSTRSHDLAARVLLACLRQKNINTTSDILKKMWALVHSHVVYQERHCRSILRFWAIWLFMTSCFWLVKRKHPKYIFKCFFIKLYLESGYY